MSIAIKINNRLIKCEKGITILDVAKANDIHIPTLCHHPAVEPSGSCRLCVVEITHDDWGGWKGIVTSCLYPVEDGLIVFTDTEKVIEHRKVIVDLLLARSPNSEVVQKLALEYGVTKTSYKEREDATDCILCGLCTRICGEIGVFAISTTRRGYDKVVLPPLTKPPEDCIGCLSCALNCPTGCIEYKKTKSTRKIWNREFKLVKSTDGTYLDMTEEMKEFFSKKSGLDKNYFEKSDFLKRQEIAKRFASISYK